MCDLVWHSIVWLWIHLHAFHFSILCMCMSVYMCRGSMCMHTWHENMPWPVRNAHFALFLIFQLEELFHIQSLLICNWATTEHCKPDRRLLSRAWRTDWMWAWREWLMCDFKQDQALEKDEGWFGHSRVPGVCSV